MPVHLAAPDRHCNGHRPHRSLQREPPQRQPGNTIDIAARIEREKVLGGLISSSAAFCSAVGSPCPSSTRSVQCSGHHGTSRQTPQLSDQGRKHH
jgi:hypothetical protein